MPNGEQVQVVRGELLSPKRRWSPPRLYIESGRIRGRDITRRYLKLPSKVTIKGGEIDLGRSNLYSPEGPLKL